MGDEQVPSLSDLRVIGQFTPLEIALKLHEMGDESFAQQVTRPAGAAADEMAPFFSFRDWFRTKAWQHTSHKFGFIRTGDEGSAGPYPIVDVGQIPADPQLLCGTIDIHLERLRVYEYPGGGEHQVMLTFQAKNQSCSL